MLTQWFYLLLEPAAFSDPSSSFTPWAGWWYDKLGSSSNKVLLFSMIGIA